MEINRDKSLKPKADFWRLLTDLMTFPFGLSVEEGALARAEGQEITTCGGSKRRKLPEVEEDGWIGRCPKLEHGWERAGGQPGSVEQEDHRRS